MFTPSRPSLHFNFTQLSGVATRNKGVLVGYWTEERKALQPGRHAFFAGTSTSKSTYGAELGAAANTIKLKDTQRKYVCSGKDTILQHAEPSSSSAPIRGLGSITQLSYSKPDLAQTTVQQHLRTGHKATDMRMPACPQRSVATAAHRQLLDKEASESKWATTFRMAAESASQGAIGGVCKREGCRPAAEGGQPAQIGREAVGQCAQLFDETWMQIGLQR